MNSGSFPFIAGYAFLVIFLAVPTISFFRLQSARDNAVDIECSRTLASVFFTMILSWLAISLIAAILLIVMLALFVFANLHARGTHAVPLMPLLMFLALMGGMGFAGLLLHDQAKGKLFD